MSRSSSVGDPSLYDRMASERLRMPCRSMPSSAQRRGSHASAVVPRIQLPPQVDQVFGKTYSNCDSQGMHGSAAMVEGCLRAGAPPLQSCRKLLQRCWHRPWHRMSSLHGRQPHGSLLLLRPLGTTLPGCCQRAGLICGIVT